MIFLVRDAFSAELLGVPSVAVMTEKFASAAGLLGRALPADGYPFVVIRHSVGSPSPDELAERARLAAETCRKYLVRARQ